MSARDEEDDDTTLYTVVVNHEEQYSIWPESSDLPSGWTRAGVTGSKAACLSHIESVWTDMRPLSLREEMALAEAAQADAEPASISTAAASPPEESLPLRLSRGPQPVELSVRPERTLDALVHQIGTGCVQVRFTATRGGTELTVPLDPATRDRLRSQAARAEGPLQVSGCLTLDYVPVRCVADIDLTTFAGTGTLQILA
jgi:uncharacterized protein YbdZ (MbtH family)